MELLREDNSATRNQQAITFPLLHPMVGTGDKNMFSSQAGDKETSPQSLSVPQQAERNVFPSETKPCLVLSFSQWLQMLNESRQFSSLSRIVDNVFQIRDHSKKSLFLYFESLISKVQFIKTVKSSQKQFLYLLFL